MRHRPDFERTVRTGRRVSRPRLTVHVADHHADSVAGPLVGFVVNRGVGSAAVRNRVRRQLRHIVASRLDRIASASPNAQIVVRAAPRSSGARNDELAADFDSALDALTRPGRTR
jgi:ribonuclease P protein component